MKGRATGHVWGVMAFKAVEIEAKMIKQLREWG